MAGKLVLLSRAAFDGSALRPAGKPVPWKGKSLPKGAKAVETVVPAEEEKAPAKPSAAKPPAKG